LAVLRESLRLLRALQALNPVLITSKQSPMYLPVRYITNWPGTRAGGVDTKMTNIYFALGHPPVELFGGVYAHLGTRGVTIDQIERIRGPKSLWKLADYAAAPLPIRSEFRRESTIFVRWWAHLEQERFVLEQFPRAFTVDWSAVAIDRLERLRSFVTSRLGSYEHERLWWSAIAALHEDWLEGCPLTRAPRRQTLVLAPARSVIPLEHFGTDQRHVHEALKLYSTCPFQDDG